MKKLYTSAKAIGLTVSLFLCQNLNAQFTVDFESWSIPVDSFWNNSDAMGPYIESNTTFSINYDSTFMSYDGFALSTMRDDTTAGYGNQYSSYSGDAYSGNTYAVYYPGFGATHFAEYQYDVQFGGIWVNNSTYAALSMRDGDQFAKQFGSPNGADGNPDGTNGEDWFLLSIYIIDGNDNQIDSTGFYLADYRFVDPQDDYIVDSWTFIDLSQLQVGRKLAFGLSSSDVGQWGMNTPAYFALDDLTLNGTLGLTEHSTSALSVYPNPARNQISFSGVELNKVIVTDLSGKTVLSLEEKNVKTLNIESLKSGMYIVSVFSGKELVGQQKLIKQ